VLHSGRRWWYQPQAVRSERSGLIATQAVWFLSRLLRCHGYDHTSLETMIGTAVTTSSWRVGDVVSPSEVTNSVLSPDSSSCLIGRIVTETPHSSTPSTHNPQSGTVVVEFVGRAFANALGIKPPGLASVSTPSVETRRVRVSKLLHTSELHGCQPISQGDTMDVDSDHEENVEGRNEDLVQAKNHFGGPAREKILADIEAVGRLEQSAIESLTKECRKSSDALASLFSAGLPDAVMSAIDIAERQMNSLEAKDDLAEKLAAVGDLANAIAEQLFGDRKDSTREIDAEPIVSQRQELLQNVPRSLRNQQSSRVDSRNGVHDSVEVRRDLATGGDSDDADVPSQQRRNMLMSLMSRASHRRNAGSFLSDLAEAGIESFAHPRGIGNVNGGSPFDYGITSSFCATAK
jgi:hypothetical protein